MEQTGPAHRITYTEAMVRDAVRTFVWRRGVAGQKGLWTVAAAMLGLIVWLVWRGDRSWVVGVVAATVLLAPLCLGLVWVAHHRNTVGRFRRMREPVAEVAVRPDGLALASDLGSGHVAWAAITEIWERPGYWMLFTGPAQFITLPLDGIPAADLDRVRQRADRR
ncbi:MAG: YcxB family protein [Methylobacterium frigidaeris]